MSKISPNIWQQFNNTASEAVERVRDSVVQIHSQEGAMGAGTIWHSDGLIITSAHVVADGDYVRKALTVELANGDAYPAHILAFDPDADIAALTIQAKDLSAIQVGHSSKLRPGEYLLAMGHPWNIWNAVTGGIVIGTGMNLPEQAEGSDWVAIAMRMRPGHSGGPLFNMNGSIVGINTKIHGPEVSYAVPVDVVKRFLQERLGSVINAIPGAALYQEETHDALEAYL
ncbi:trypsin-like peptidase domain-containing protein [Phototrophicus methaneseepsis]|uniref:Trypsin-like peptidase domain-containing protein n=1 Tax=Phototrophicus methaneseepsis TaxID=2710758 RepID=A0A7S8IGK0_9CHLR|nr:trypsin-like peptidase domain-containing protein [Phototrophicus methaneseepsis]QPC84734.1 trypsin-like peptidase domain-containing protein [Phototrophicus methaneseepsis]